MTPAEISEKLKAKLGDRIVEIKLEGVIDPFIKVTPGAIGEAAVFLRDDADCAFDFLMCLSGVDYTKGVLGVVYHLCSMTKRHKMTLKADVPSDDPRLPSV